MKNSKSEAEGLQETQHSDSFCTEKPNSIYQENETPVGDKDSKDGTDRSKEKIYKDGMKNTPDLKEKEKSCNASRIKKKLEKFRYEPADALVIEDENESRLKEAIKDEDQERSGRECESLSQNIRRNLTELRQQQEVLIIDDDNEAEIRSSIVEDRKQVKK